MSTVIAIPKTRLRRSQDETHATGTSIHWGERDPDDRWNRVAITCHGCHRKSFTHINSIKHEKWSGLCGECIEQRGSHLKFTHDERFESGTIIHWGEPDPKAPDKRLMVTCGHCGGKRSITRVAASILKHDGGSWKCRQCHNASLRAHFTGQREGLASSKQTKDGGQPLPKGKRGRTAKPVDEFLADVKEVIRELFIELRSDREITLPVATARLQLRDQDFSEDVVRMRVKRKTGLKWEEFVKSVLKDCEHKSN
jgi:hypothetical protein